MLAMSQVLRAAGVAVTAFKTGPDFIDPLWHQAVCGAESENLDTHLMGDALCRYRFRKSAGSFSCIEGVMGMLDGKDGVGAEGSSLHLAGVLKVPIWLVVDASGMSASIAALVRGFLHYTDRRGCRITGVIANRVGGPAHASMLADVLDDQKLPPLLAWIDNQAPSLKERHLGLALPEDAPAPNFAPHWHGEIETLVESAGIVEVPAKVAPRPAADRLAGLQVAVARDAACCFLYRANLDWLQEEGAVVQFFSPLTGDPVPANSDAIWLPGGYPELYAETLSRSHTWESLREFVKGGKPVLAECGGMMLLGDTLIDLTGNEWSMAAVLPIRSLMHKRLAALGYRTSGDGVRGHEFHHSSSEGGDELSSAFELNTGDRGVRYQAVRASYVHWYFPSAPDVVAGWFRGNP